MFNPLSSTVPPVCILMTRLAPMALSTTAPGTSASMVRARSMQTAVPVHMSLVSSYVPAASKILLIELSAIAAVNSPTVLADTSFRCRRCSATSKAVVLMTVLTTSVPGGLSAVGDRLGTGGEGFRGGLFGEMLKDCCTEGGGCIWARKKGAHCGGQPTPPTEERNTEPLGSRCSKACPMALLVSPFEHCHTLWVSLSVGTAWSCGSAGIMCSVQGGGGMQRAEVQWCT